MPPSTLRDLLNGPRALAAWAAARPRRALAAVLLATLAAAPGLLRLELRTDGHALVPPEHPTVLFDARVRETFELRDPLVVLLETSHPEGIFHPDTLARLEGMTRALAAIPEVGWRHVASLATERRDRVYPGTLDFRPFLDPFPATPEAMETLRGDVEAVDLLTGTLVSADRSATAVLVGVPPVRAPDGWRPDGAAPDRVALYRRIVERVAPFEGPEHRITVVGAPAAEALLGNHILRDLTLLIPLALGVLAAVVWLGCRRLWGMALALGEVGTCLVFTFGVMGWAGVPVYLPTAVLPVVLTCLGLADEIHVFWHYQRRLAEPGAGEEPLAATFDAMTRPVVLTSVTTALAFLSFLASPIVPVKAFGAFAALGVLYCLLFTLTAIPAALALLPRERLARPSAGGVRRAAEPGAGGPGPGEALADLLGRALERPRLTLVAFGLITLGAVAGLPRLQVQDSWIDGFAPDSSFRTDTERVDRLLHGTHLLLVHLRFRPPEGSPEGEPPRGGRRSGPLLSPEILGEIDRFEEHLRGLPGVGGVLGPASHLKTVSYLWLGRNEAERRIPPTPARVDLALQRFDTGRGEHRRREVFADDLAQGVVTVFLEDADYRRTADLMEDIRAWAEEHLEPLGAELGFAGDVAVSQAMIPAIVDTQLSSLLLALVGAVVVVSLLTRSLGTGVAAVAPALVAVAWILGGMGWGGLPLGVATSMFCAITLGVGVDHGIHLLESARRRRRAGDGSPASGAVAEAGPAIVTDAVAIALGFGLLMVSRVPANGRLGLLVAGALGISALAALAGLGSALRLGEIGGAGRSRGGT